MKLTTPNLHFINRSMYEFPHLWQMELLLPHRLASFSKEMGLSGGVSSEHIKSLWQAGLLKADLVSCEAELGVEGLTILGTDPFGKHLYADNRLVELPHGIDNLFKDLAPLPKNVQLFFHPFRIWYIWGLYNLLTPLGINPLQRLIDKGQYSRIFQKINEYHDGVVNNLRFTATLQHLEYVTKLSIATEPCTFEFLFNIRHKPVHITDDDFDLHLQIYKEQLAEYYSTLELDDLKSIMNELCLNAERLDPNKHVHNILRLTKRDWRIQHVKGKLGGAIYFLTMAEMIRRFAEVVFNVELPEEDELGRGIAVDGYKNRDFGTPRLFDGKREHKNLYLRDLGLDYSIRLRWYVEGNTEWGALTCMFEHDTSVELINLRGKFVEKKDSLVFEGNLRNDARAQIFSFCSFDSDRSDNLRVVRKAIERDEICGAVLVSTPDFEDGNFTLSELKAILWDIAVENNANDEDRLHFDEIAKRASNWAELSKAVRAFDPLAHFSKDEEWGRRLMAFAWSEPIMPSESHRDRRKRPVIEAVEAGFQAQRTDYHYMRTNYRIDPVTGKPVLRKEMNGHS